MPSIYRLRVAWSGTPVVGAGLSTFFLGDTPATFHVSVASFFNAIKNGFPTGITWTMPDNGDVLNDVNGELTGTWTEAGGASVVSSTGTVNFANGVGARVVWGTAGIHAGRRVKGSTFLVPLTSGVYLSDGTIDNTTVATFSTAAAALVAAEPNLVIWSRPKVGLVGESNAVTSGQCIDKVSWLRSRRT